MASVLILAPAEPILRRAEFELGATQRKNTLEDAVATSSLVVDAEVMRPRHEVIDATATLGVMRFTTYTRRNHIMHHAIYTIREGNGTHESCIIRCIFLYREYLKSEQGRSRSGSLARS